MTSFGNHLVDGSSLGRSIVKGFEGQLLGELSGGLIGGISGGISACRDGRRFWDGATVRIEPGIQHPVGSVVSEYEHSCTESAIQSVDASFGDYKVTQQDIRRGLGGDPQKKGLVDKEAVDYYCKLTGHKYDGQITVLKKSPQDIQAKMMDGHRVIINLNNGYDANGKLLEGHCVVMRSIDHQYVQKINGSIYHKYLYYVMNPSDGMCHRISERKIINAINVLYIK